MVSSNDVTALTDEEIGEFWDWDISHRWVRERLAARLRENGYVVVKAGALEADRDAKAERMPEDVQKLVEKAQVRTGEWTDIANATTDIRLIAGLADALEAAYSQKGADDEPR